MKRYLLILLAFLSIVNISAQEYAMTAPIGYGAATTGGGSAMPIMVNTYGALKSALESNATAVVIVEGNITVPSGGRISVGSNKTLLGLPGATLLSDTQTASGSGILRIANNESNVIIRNIIFEGPGAYDVDGNDLLENRGTRVWIDHCEFYDGIDGNLDNTDMADNVSITWCKFGYKKPPRAGGSGGSNDHRFSNLIGGSADMRPADGRYSITFAYCYWSEGVVQRMPRARNAQIHMLNGYYNTSVGTVALGLEAGINGTDCYVEAVHFERVGGSAGSTPAVDGRIYQKYTTSGTVYGNNDPNLTVVNSRRGATTAFHQQVAGAAVAQPNYPYTALPVADVKPAVTGSCGAGATLIVTPDGKVSSPCSQDYPNISLASANETLNQNVTQNTAVQNIVFTWGGTATGLTATELPDNLFYEINQTNKTLTIRGIATMLGVFHFTVGTTGGEGVREMSGTITVKSADAKQIAFVTIPNDPADAPVLEKLNANPDFNVTVINANDTGVDYSGYDLIVISATPNSGSNGLAAIEAVDKPKLLLKPFQLGTTRWNWGTAGNTAQTTMTITNKTHEIFSNLEFTGANNDELVLFSALTTNAVTGITVWVNAGISAAISELAIAKGTPANQSIVEIPIGTNMNGTIVRSRFLMIGLSEYSSANLTPAATQLVENSCYYLMGMNIPNSIGNLENDALVIRQSDGQISVEGVEVSALALFNIAGEQIANSGKATLTISGMGRGVYILSVRTKAGNVINRKMIL